MRKETKKILAKLDWTPSERSDDGRNEISRDLFAELLEEHARNVVFSSLPETKPAHKDPFENIRRKGYNEAIGATVRRFHNAQKHED